MISAEVWFWHCCTSSNLCVQLNFIQTHKPLTFWIWKIKRITAISRFWSYRVYQGFVQFQVGLVLGSSYFLLVTQFLPLPCLIQKWSKTTPKYLPSSLLSFSVKWKSQDRKYRGSLTIDLSSVDWLVQDYSALHYPHSSACDDLVKNFFFCHSNSKKVLDNYLNCCHRSWNSLAIWEMGKVYHSLTLEWEKVLTVVIETSAAVAVVTVVVKNTQSFPIVVGMHILDLAYKCKLIKEVTWEPIFLWKWKHILHLQHSKSLTRLLKSFGTSSKRVNSKWKRDASVWQMTAIATFRQYSKIFSKKVWTSC